MGGRLSDWSDVAVGSEEENYLRVLQVAGLARQRPWSLRPFAPGELAGLVPDSVRDPWNARARLPAMRARSAALDVLWPAVGVTYNSGFPYSWNDGAVWTGRGITVLARGGFAARWRWFSARFEPVAFWTANRPTSLVPNGLSGPQRFGDALEPFLIDNPQRFGDHAFGRIGLGQSTVRVDALGLTAGLSTANQWVGPALIDPLVLGDNAAGFPHAFVGTSHPLNVSVGTVHVRLEAGRLDQSVYSTVPTDSARRLGLALVATGTLRWVPGLEVGGTRFFHEAWHGATSARSRLGTVVQNVFIPGDQTAVPQNQIASLFARWVLAPAQAEVWGEFMRNDASANSRDLWVEPDHNSGYLLGFRRVWRRPGQVVAVRAEHLNMRITHLARVRGQTRPYQHGTLRQGHTEGGEVLGSAAGQGGLATTLGLDRYDAHGRWTFEVARRVRQSSLSEGALVRQWDVYQVVRAERLRFGAYHDLFAGVSAITELNRNFARDAYSVRLDAGWRFGPRLGGRGLEDRR